MKKSRSRKLKEQGQSMVELALTITILMVLLAGTIDLGRGFFTWLAMRDAAQEGASYGSINPPTTAAGFVRIRDRVWDNLEQVVRDPKTDIDIEINVLTKPCLGNTIQVDVRYPDFTIAMPVLSLVLGTDKIPIHATVNDTILTPSCK